jgi:hypothetical protein
MRHNSGLALFTYMIMGFLVFHSALRIGFLGDFAGDLYQSQNNWFNFPAYQWNFYVPAMAIYYGLYKIFHLYPLPYHVLHLSLIFINAWLVYLLAKELKFEVWQCWLAGLLALFNSTAFEAYFWLSTIPKTLTTGFGLVALIFLARLRQTRASIWGWGYLIMICAGMSLESVGLILPLMGLCLDTYYRPWRVTGTAKASPISGLRLHFWSFGIAGIFLIIRHFLGIKPYVINMPLIQKLFTLTSTIYSTIFHGLSEPSFFSVNGSNPVAIILSLVLLPLLMWTYYVKQGPDRRRFVALLLLWIGACLPHTVGANFQSRYLYFPGIFAALVLVDFLGALKTRFYTRKSAWLFISFVIAGYLITDLHAFHQSLSYYMDATRIYDAGIKKITTELPQIPPGARLVLIDFPDSIKRPRITQHGQLGRHRILVYRNGIACHLSLLYTNSNLSVTLLKLSNPNDDDNPDPLGSPASPVQLAKLLAAPHTTAFRYLPENPENFVIIREP